MCANTSVTLTYDSAISVISLLLHILTTHRRSNRRMGLKVTDVRSLIVELVRDLSSHAARHGVIEQISDIVYQTCNLAKGSINNSQNIANDGETLQVVIDPNEAVVTRIRSEIVLFHHVGTSRRNRNAIANTGLEEKTKIRARVFVAGTTLDAAADGEVALEALVLRHVVLEGLAAKHVLRAAAGKWYKLTETPKAAGWAVCTRSMHLKSIQIKK